MNHRQESDLVAVLDPAANVRAQAFGPIAAMGLRAVGFDRPAKLSAALAQGHRFAMLVLSFNVGGELARVALEHLAECAGPQVPVMLLMSSDQVELATIVMGSDRSDFLLAPYTADELGTRLSQLYWRWCDPERGDLVRSNAIHGFGHGKAEQPLWL